MRLSPDCRLWPRIVAGVADKLREGVIELVGEGPIEVKHGSHLDGRWRKNYSYTVVFSTEGRGAERVAGEHSL